MTHSSLFLLLLNLLGLSHIDIAFHCSINDGLADIATLTKLYLGRSQIWLNVEINEAPMLQEGMKSDDATDVPR